MIEDTYFACLVHDLKTPIYAQKQIIDLFLNNTFGEITAAQRDVLIEFQKSAEYLGNLISDILSSYLYENGQVRLNKEKFDFSEFTKEIIKELFICKNQIRLEISPLILCADKAQMKRAIINLVANAVKYSIKDSKILIKAKKINDEIHFKITNKSSYLLPKDMKSFFEKFKTQEPYNSGLGLYIVKQIITAHKGSVFVRKERGNTCTFGFKIPVSF